MPWMRSRFSRNCGTQNVWLTSSVRRTKCTEPTDGDLDRRRAHLAGTFHDLVLFGELEAPAPLESGDVDDDCVLPVGVDFVTLSCVATLNPKSAATTTIGVTVYSTSIGMLYGF